MWKAIKRELLNRYVLCIILCAPCLTASSQDVIYRETMGGFTLIYDNYSNVSDSILQLGMGNLSSLSKLVPEDFTLAISITVMVCDSNEEYQADSLINIARTERIVKSCLLAFPYYNVDIKYRGENKYITGVSKKTMIAVTMVVLDMPEQKD